MSSMSYRYSLDALGWIGSAMRSTGNNVKMTCFQTSTSCTRNKDCIAIRGSPDSQTQRLYVPWEIHWTWIVLLYAEDNWRQNRAIEIMWFVCACSVTRVLYSLAYILTNNS